LGWGWGELVASFLLKAVVLRSCSLCVRTTSQYTCNDSESRRVPGLFCLVLYLSPAWHSRRSLLQAGTARFMNAPIVSTDALEQEAGPAQPAATKPAKPAATFQDTAHTQQQLGTKPSQQQAGTKPTQARGLLSADSINTSRRREYDRRWRQERINRYRRCVQAGLFGRPGDAAHSFWPLLLTLQRDADP
jgi:hypothetical protein